METETTLTGLQSGTTYEVQVLARNAEGDGPWSANGTGATQRLNVPPSIATPEDGVGGLVRQVTENAPAGALVGAPVAASDNDGDALTYSVTGSAAFEIDAASGQLRVAEGATLDYETTSSYTLTVGVSDGKNADHQPDASTDATVDVTVEVADVPPPAAPDAPTVGPLAAQPTTSLAVSWIAPADNGAAITDYDVRYRAQGETAWTAHEFTGTGTLTTLTGLDAGTGYEVQVLARSLEGDSSWSDNGTGRTLNEAPVFDPPDNGENGPVREIEENSPAGTAVGNPVTASDNDGDALTYTVTGSAAFVIDAASGQLRVADGATLDYEAAASYTVTVGVSDGRAGGAGRAADGHGADDLAGHNVDGAGHDR